MYNCKLIDCVFSFGRAASESIVLKLWYWITSESIENILNSMPENTQQL